MKTDESDKPASGYSFAVIVFVWTWFTLATLMPSSEFGTAGWSEQFLLWIGWGVVPSLVAAIFVLYLVQNVRL